MHTNLVNANPRPSDMAAPIPRPTPINWFTAVISSDLPKITGGRATRATPTTLRDMAATSTQPILKVI